MKTTVEVWTDGACRGNPGPGGWAVLLRAGAHERTLSGAEAHTTNNRMELMAVIAAFEALRRPSHVRLHADSQYVLKGIDEWIGGWKRRGWKTAAGAPVKNADLWRRLDGARAGHEVEWCWVKGHSGVVDNERVDALANAAIDALLASGGGST